MVGVKKILQSLSEKQGKKMNSPASAKDIPEYIKFFKTFNDFFARELKPGTRPIAYEDRDSIAICAADCRLMAFQSVSDRLRLWIKVRKFSVEGLLGTNILSTQFSGGSLVIFRLASQDYHYFYPPVSGVVGNFVDIPGCLYMVYPLQIVAFFIWYALWIVVCVFSFNRPLVNPMAVNSKYCNGFTENKRGVTIISSPDFGKFGYFSFGGITVICVFEKDALELDADLLANSEGSLETIVEVGMTLGVSKRSRSKTEIPILDNCRLED